MAFCCLGERNVDADLLPHAVQHLRLAFVADIGRIVDQVDLEALAIRPRFQAGLVQHGRSLLRVVGIHLAKIDCRIVRPGDTRIDGALHDRAEVLEYRFPDVVTIDGGEQRLAHFHLIERRASRVADDQMILGRAALANLDLWIAGNLRILLGGEIIEVDVVDLARLQRQHAGRRIGDHTKHDLVQIWQALAPVMRVAFQRDGLAAHPFLHHERPGANRFR